MNTTADTNRKEGARVGVVALRDSLGFSFTSDGATYYLHWRSMDKHIEAGEMTYQRPMREGVQFTFTFKPER